MIIPRIVARAGSFAFIAVPERLDSMFFRHGGSMIAEATGNGTWNMITSALSSASITDTTLSAAVAAETAAASPAGPFSLSHFGQVRNFGGIFTYMTSRWALACFTLVSLKGARALLRS